MAGAVDDQWPKKVIEGSTCTQTHLYKHSWELMMAAYEARFVSQTHPRLPNLVGWAMADRAVDEQRGLETYVRTITVAGDVPWLVARATGLETLEIVQTVEVDRFRRKISMVSKNTTWRDRLQMDEDCSYFADPDEPAWTGFKQTATLSVSLGGYGIESTVEGFLISAYSDGIDKVSSYPWHRNPDSLPSDTSAPPVLEQCMSRAWPPFHLRMVTVIVDLFLVSLSVPVYWAAAVDRGA
jgi:hypothetical protein